MEEHAILHHVTTMWLGLGMKETFTEWKSWVQRRVAQVITITFIINAPVFSPFSVATILHNVCVKLSRSIYFKSIPFTKIFSSFQRRKDRKQAVRQAWHDYKVLNAGLVVAGQEINKWEERWDEYNDTSYWVHRYIYKVIVPFCALSQTTHHLFK